ncbi:MAG: DUF1573 domain-containing protein [Flavobacterium sp.]
MKNSIKKGIALLFVASALLLSSCSNQKHAEMKFEEQEFDFGKIIQGDKVTHNFKFANTGETDLVIDNAKGSCGCTIPEYPKTPIKSGESGTIKVSFNSAGKSGEVEKTVTIICNTKNKMEQIKIKANIEMPEKAQTN